MIPHIVGLSIFLIKILYDTAGGSNVNIFHKVNYLSQYLVKILNNISVKGGQ